MNYRDFGTVEMLKLRIKSAIKQQKKICLLLGSGLVQPNYETGLRGVASVQDVIESIHQVFVTNNHEQLFLDEVPPTISKSEQYQKSMQVLLSCFGQGELNKIVVNAVMGALLNKKLINEEKEPLFASLEKKVENWYIQPGIDAVGELYVDFNELFAKPILTSNFDPLIEVSIRKHRGTPHSTILVDDGKFLNQTSDNVHSVVHFHGYWHGTDTLHTAEQLKKYRPQLKGDLKKVLQDSVLLVVGYGGWNDVFTNTLINVISEGNSNFDVLWTFYEEEVQVIQSSYSSLFSSMHQSLGQRVNLYKGVDCNLFFPALLASLNNSELESSISVIRAGVSKSDQDAFPCDVPPNNIFWVGRTSELKVLNETNYKICFITGIGGQGKSGLASHYIKSLGTDDYELWDWRDCKEQDHKLQTIFISQIERLSKGKYRGTHLIDEKIEDLIHLFFEVLGTSRIVFVYDNVDKYIDLEEFKPVAGLEELIKRINTYKHRSVFIFTCRPHVSLTFSSFIEIQLNPLSKTETVELFNEYSPPISKTSLNEIALQAHSLTNGHALWLNMIAAQCKRGKDVVQSFLDSYRHNKSEQKNNSSYTLAENTLDVVWKSLNTKQQVLLRGLSEMITALTKDELAEIFRSELTVNQFNRCFNALNSLNLLVIKSASGREDLIELHPLVKEYIAYKYKPNERAKFIMMFVNFYNQLILLIKPKLDADSPLAYFEKYTHKAELEINNKDFKAALTSLHEVSEIIRAAGFTEEYTRVALILFERIDWFKAVAQEFNYFDEEFNTLVRTLTEMGRNSLVDELLDKYKNVIPGKSKAYINYCNMMCYYNWFTLNFSQAIEWGEKGTELVKNSVGLNSDIEYNLALALRDSNITENRKRALNIFLKGESLSEIMDGKIDSIHFSSPYFGNIGRCLWFDDRIEDALFFYYKSLSLLLEEKETNTVINQGYASLWIFEALMKKADEEHAMYFFKFCLINWEATAHTKAMNLKKQYRDLLNQFENIHQLSNWEIESFCKKYVEKRLKGW